MTLELIDVSQNSDEWYTARCGVPTASEFHTVMAMGRGGGESITRKKYMYKLAGEILTGEPEENFQRPEFERGHEQEEGICNWYAFTYDAELTQVGFYKSDECGGMGYSPDRIIGESGLLEVKSKKPSVLIPLLLKDEVPPEHMAQLQGGLFVTKREWIDIVCRWPGIKSLVKRVYPDREYQAKLRTSITQFNDELHDLVEKLKEG